MGVQIRDKNLLAYMGEKKILVRVISMTQSGAITQYETDDNLGNIYMPLIVDGRNVEEFKIVGEQLTLI